MIFPLGCFSGAKSMRRPSGGASRALRGTRAVRRPTDLRRRCTRPWGSTRRRRLLRPERPAGMADQHFDDAVGDPIQEQTCAEFRHRGQPNCSKSRAAVRCAAPNPVDPGRDGHQMLRLPVWRTLSRQTLSDSTPTVRVCRSLGVENVERRRLVEELDQSSLRRPLRYMRFPAVGCRPVRPDGVTGFRAGGAPRSRPDPRRGSGAARRGAQGFLPRLRPPRPPTHSIPSCALGRHVHLNCALARAAQDLGVHGAGK